jgi:hypothetical protein
MPRLEQLSPQFTPHGKWQHVSVFRNSFSDPQVGNLHLVIVVVPGEYLGIGHNLFLEQRRF